MSPGEIAARPPFAAPVFRHRRHAALWPILTGRAARRFVYRALRLDWTAADYERACRELNQLIREENP